MKKTAFNLNEKTASALCYVLGPLSGLIMYIFEMRRGTRNTVVIFHAFQCIVFLGGFALLQLILSFLPLMFLINMALDLFLTIMWAYLVYKAFTGEIYKIPIIGDVCWEKANKM